jgi:3'-phosphoadenosine 5'-phosphosulfate sulfotransferase
MEIAAKKAALTLRQEKDTIFVTGDVTRETAPQLMQTADGGQDLYPGLCGGGAD